MPAAPPRFPPRRLLLLLAVLAAAWWSVHRLPVGTPGAPGPTRVAFPLAAGETSAAGRRDLAADEAAGGHTLARHVGRSDAELAARLAAEPNLAAASCFTDRATAERAVGATLVAQAPQVAYWRARARPGNLALLWRGDGSVLGRVLERGARQSRPATGVRVVLRHRGDGWYVLTAYPEIAR